MSPPADLSLTVAGGASEGAARPAVVGRTSVEDFDGKYRTGLHRKRAVERSESAGIRLFVGVSSPGSDR